MLTLLLLVACARSASPDEAPRGTDPATAPSEEPAMTCLETLSLDSGASVLSEQRAAGPAAPDFFERYPATAITPDQTAIRAAKVGDTAVLYLTPDRTGVVADARLVSDLVVADVTRMGAGETAALGTLTEAGRAALPGRAAATFLLRARVVATWVHIGAELCLASEEATEAGYRASYTGSHTFFTSRRNEEPLAFEVLVGSDGALSVVNRAP